MLQPLLQHVKAWPRRRIQVPALLHNVVHNFRTAVWTVHLVSLLHSRHDVLQWLEKKKKNRSKPGQRLLNAAVQDPTSPTLTPHLDKQHTEEKIYLFSAISTYYSWVRYSAKRVNLPKQNTVAPNVRFGGKFLKMKRKKGKCNSILFFFNPCGNMQGTQNLLTHLFSECLR